MLCMRGVYSLTCFTTNWAMFPCNCDLFICRWTTAQHLLCFCGHYQVSAPAPSFLESQNPACKDYNVHVIGRIIIEGVLVKNRSPKIK